MRDRRIWPASSRKGPWNKPRRGADGSPCGQIVSVRQSDLCPCSCDTVPGESRQRIRRHSRPRANLDPDSAPPSRRCGRAGTPDGHGRTIGVLLRVPGDNPVKQGSIPSGPVLEGILVHLVHLLVFVVHGASHTSRNRLAPAAAAARIGDMWAFVRRRPAPGRSAAGVHAAEGTGLRFF